MNVTLALKTHLVNEGVNGNLIFRDHLPDKPDDVVVLTDTGGIEPSANDTSIVSKQNKTFQVYVRGKVHADAIALCDDLRSALVGRMNMTIGDLNFKNILMMSEFQSIGKDSVGRFEFTANFKCLVIDRSSDNVLGGGSIDAGAPDSVYGGNINLDGGEV